MLLGHIFCFPHVFSLHVTLTRVLVTHFTHARHIRFYEEIWLMIPKLSLLPFLIWSTGTPSTFSSMLTHGNYFYDFLFTSPIEEIFTKWGLHLRGRIYLKKCKLFPFSVTPCGQKGKTEIAEMIILNVYPFT